MERQIMKIRDKAMAKRKDKEQADFTERGK